jgi:hypothetical protein
MDLLITIVLRSRIRTLLRRCACRLRNVLTQAAPFDVYRRNVSSIRD